MVSPESLDLTLQQAESTTQQVSWTFNPLCIRPFQVDVIASSPDAQVTNLTGVLINSCGGDTSTFDVTITGTGTSQSFDLQFVDAESGNLLDSIPVTITAGAPPLCSIDLSLRLNNGILFISLGLGTLEPAEFNLFISTNNSTYPLLEAPVVLPILDPPRNFTPQISDFPDFGTVGILATITSGQDGIRCSAWQTIDSSPGS